MYELSDWISVFRFLVQESCPQSATISVVVVETEKQTLRRLLAERQREKAELERRVRGLEARYREEVAPLEEKVLRLWAERLRAAAQTRMQSARLRNAYHDAQRAYASVREARDESPASERDAKAAYRRASKHCHPDRVPESVRAEAAATFRVLESARESGYTTAVEAIAQALEDWGFPTRAQTSKARDVESLREAIGEIETAIQHLRGSDAYQVLETAGTVDAAIEAWTRDLRRRLRRLTETRGATGRPQ